MATTASAPPWVPVVLAGGVGSRLWPLSRASHPKPLINLDDGESLLEKTYARLLALPGAQAMVTVTHQDLYFSMREAFEGVVASGGLRHTYLCEPLGRNSAPAVALAAHWVRQTWGASTTLLICPADHLITAPERFMQVVEDAMALAEQGQLVTLGVPPTSAQTGYGYIEAEGSRVKRFHEKPDAATAEAYVASGTMLWNAGMCCARADVLLNELAVHAPEVLSGAEGAWEQASVLSDATQDQVSFRAEAFEAMPSVSLDVAVLERSKRVAVVQAAMGWSDVGTWNELASLTPPDPEGNTTHGEVLLSSARGCHVHAGNRLVCALGVQDLVVVDTDDALLVMDRSHEQDVRGVVEELKRRNHPTYANFPTVHRPWGTYTVLQASERFKIKRIEVKPGAALSLQRHQYRSEHWVVVDGLAEVRNGADTLSLEPNQSTYIPAGHVHRLKNPTDAPLVLIEVQCGTYLGEDDIERFEDDYGREQPTLA